MHGLRPVQGVDQHGLRGALFDEYAQGGAGERPERAVLFQVMEQARPRLPVVVKGVADPLQVARVPALPQVDDLLIDFVRQLLRHVLRVQT